MHRIDTLDSVGGKFSEGNPSVPRLPTRIDRHWANAVQEEIAQTIEAVGISLRERGQDDADAGYGSQLLEAIRALSGSIPGCRLELTNTWANGTVQDQIGNTLYLVPHTSASMPVPLSAAGTFFVVTLPSSGISIDRTGLVTDTNYDVFLYDAAAPKLHLEPWSGISSRGFTLSRSGSFLVNDGVLGTLGAKLGLYVGTIRTVTQSGVQFVDSAKSRFVFNYFNRLSKQLRSSTGLTNTNYYPAVADDVIGVLHYTDAGSDGLSVQFVSGQSIESGQLHGPPAEVTMAINAAVATSSGETVRAGVVAQTATTSFHQGSATITASAGTPATQLVSHTFSGNYSPTFWHFGVQCSAASSSVFSFGTKALDGTIRC